MADVGASFRLCLIGAGVLVIALLTSACGSEAKVEVAPRFLLGGWIAPKGEDAGTNPFAESLRTFVITTEDEIREFLNGVDLVRPRGDPQTLFRTDFEEDLILAAYFLWRPLKGEPLSIQGAFVRDDSLRVSLELVEEPQGEEFPYLLAPMTIAAINKARLPAEGPLSIVFSLNGEEVKTLEVTIQ